MYNYIISYGQVDLWFIVAEWLILLKSYYVSLILYVTVDRPRFLGVTQGCSETGWLP